MTPELTEQLYLAALRWAHILGAIVAVGGLFFARYGLHPAMSSLDTETQSSLHEAIRRRWLPWVIGAITLLLASGLANFLLFNQAAKAWDDGTWMRQNGYHALFGVKFLLALAVFYFASGLVGRGEGTAWMRANRGRWLSVTLLLAIGVVLISGWMRGLHTGPNVAAAGEEGVAMPAATTGAEAESERYGEGGSVFTREEEAAGAVGDTGE